MTGAQQQQQSDESESPREFNAAAAWRALCAYLTPAELELVWLMFTQNVERAETLVASRRGESLSGREFARFMLEIAKRLDREGGATS